MSNNFLIVMTENEICYDYFKNYKKIGVERGCLDILENNQTLDVGISDFDSVLNDEFKLIQKEAKKIVHLNNEKDFLDGEMAIKYAKEHNANEIIVVAKATRRFDMNLSILWLVDTYNVKIMNKTSIIFKILKGTTMLDFQRYQDYTFITFYPLDKTNLSISGLKYEVQDLTLIKNELRAYSNQFINSQSGNITTDNDIICIMTK